MKIVKSILIIVLILIAIPLIVALFVKKDYHVEREIVINKPEPGVFNYVKFVKNQDNYSKWNMMDPAMKKAYSGTDGDVGFTYSWDSQDKHAGQGEQTIMLIAQGDKVSKIGMDIHFIRPFEARSKAYLQTEFIAENQTKVKWGFDGHMAYPMNFMLAVMDMDKAIGNDLSTGLANLKALLEKQ